MHEATEIDCTYGRGWISARKVPRDHRAIFNSTLFEPHRPQLPCTISDQLNCRWIRTPRDGNLASWVLFSGRGRGTVSLYIRGARVGGIYIDMRDSIRGLIVLCVVGSYHDQRKPPKDIDSPSGKYTKSKSGFVWCACWLTYPIWSTALHDFLHAAHSGTCTWS